MMGEAIETRRNKYIAGNEWALLNYNLALYIASVLLHIFSI